MLLFALFIKIVYLYIAPLQDNYSEALSSYNECFYFPICSQCLSIFVPLVLSLNWNRVSVWAYRLCRLISPKIMTFSVAGRVVDNSSRLCHHRISAILEVTNAELRVPIMPLALKACQLVTLTSFSCIQGLIDVILPFIAMMCNRSIRLRINRTL